MSVIVAGGLVVPAVKPRRSMVSRATSVGVPTLQGPTMTKTELKKKIRTLEPDRAKEILERIILDDIWEGRKWATSSEILDSVCGTLKENGLDE